MKRYLPTLISGLVLLAGLLLYIHCFQVATYEVALVKTFGKVTRVVNDSPELEPDAREDGLHLKWAWPIQEVDKLDLRKRTLEDRFDQTTTKDNKQLIVEAYLVWRIAKPERFYKATVNGDEKLAADRLQGILRTHKSTAFKAHDFDDLINTDPESLKFSAIEQEIRTKVQADAMAQYGIEVIEVGVKRLGLPEKTTESVFELMKNTQARLAERYRGEGESIAKGIQARAETDRDRILAYANRKAKEIRAEGDAAAARYYEVFSKDPAFAMFLRELDFLKETLKDTTTFILDFDQRPYSLFRTGPSLPPVAADGPKP